MFLIKCYTRLFFLCAKFYSHSIFSRSALVSDEYPIAIVFGAGVWNENEPSPILYDHLITASELYKTGQVRKLFLTRYNRFAIYNESEIMQQTAISLGVPDQDLVLDYVGRRTYDSCYCAVHI